MCAMIRAASRREPTKWSEKLIARAIALQVFQRNHLVVVPNCNWTGHECDLLVVTTDLRIIDVEIKISRADLKADAKKDKWWHRFPSCYDPETRGYRKVQEDKLRGWPPKAWKHYYAMPREIWTPELAESMPSSNSGIILMSRQPYDGAIVTNVERRSKPNREAQRIGAGDAINIARLASLRMWDAYLSVEGAL